MKRIPLLLTALFCISGGLVSSRGQEPSALHPASIEAAIPAYLYCEIIGSHLPSYRGDGVLFDFGQKTEAWAYNWLTDAEGHKLVFGSVVEALNYMVIACGPLRPTRRRNGRRGASRWEHMTPMPWGRR